MFRCYAKETDQLKEEQHGHTCILVSIIGDEHREIYKIVRAASPCLEVKTYRRVCNATAMLACPFFEVSCFFCRVLCLERHRMHEEGKDKAVSAD